MAMLNEKKSSERFKKANELQEARDLAKKLSGIIVRFKVKTGDNGRLFGSITSKDIADQIKAQHKIEVEKRKIVLDEPIKSAGVYNIEVKVYPEVSAKLKVEVIGE
jgi:large subunit ribosomal protein L9